MKKLLLQLDTDVYPSVFDSIVGYDGGADQVLGYGNCTPNTVKPLVEGAIFTRAPKEKRFTAIFVGGSDMAAGENLFKAVQDFFFADFRVSIILDSNGSNTTAAAGVAKLTGGGDIVRKKAVVLAGTGPVGRRAAVMLAKEGAKVAITSRQMARAQKACEDINSGFGMEITPMETKDNEARGEAIAGANIVFAAGAAGVELLQLVHWQDSAELELIADANATPPLGIGGIEANDRGQERNGKIVWGALGFGTLKLAIHRRCIEKLFTRNDQIFDVENIFAMAKKMA